LTRTLSTPSILPLTCPALIRRGFSFAAPASRWRFCIISAVAAIVSYAIGLDGAAAADVTFSVQVAWMVLRLIPGKVWLAIGEGFAEMMPWIFIANIDL
jgi:hypothetical protein